MEKRIKRNFPDEKWIELVEEAVSLVKGISPNTKTVAAVDKRELELSKKFAFIENLDIIGLQLYGWAGMYKWNHPSDYLYYFQKLQSFS